MNIDHIAEKEEWNLDGVTTGNLFVHIFAHQRELMVKYHEIEVKSHCCICVEEPYDLNNSRVQARIKDLFWRATEEMAEACEVNTHLHNWRYRYVTEPDLRHYFEELSDALHFLAEASIVANLSCYALSAHVLERHGGGLIGCPPDTFESYIYLATTIKHMGLAANCLKNKPWKQTHMETDVAKFHNRLTDAWNEFVMLLVDLGMSAKDIFVLYMKKNQVNKWRQETNY